jgi:hypothetical protein
MHHLEEWTIHRYENPKVIWEMVAEKTDFFEYERWSKGSESRVNISQY